MGKRITVNEYDYDTEIEKVTTTWPNGSQIVVRSNKKKMKSKVHIIDCSSGTPELVSCEKFKLDPIFGSIDCLSYIQEYCEKFEEDLTS